MKPLFWSLLLQWSRFGINAFVFLSATRFLSLEEFGAFATAFGAIKLAQGFHKAGISETVVIKTASPLRLNTLFTFAFVSGFFIAAGYLLLATFLETDPSFLLLAIIPVFMGLSATSDGILRKQLKIRAIALRTFFSQTVAASITFIALKLGAGATALVIFALLNTVLSGMFSILFAGWLPTKRPSLKHMRLTIKTVLHIAGRDCLNSGILPLAQVAIGICIGFSAAGAFQIATRIISMLDTLTLAPFRYLALPKLAAQKTNPNFGIEIRRSLKLSVNCVSWVWFGLASSTPQVLGTMIGTEHVGQITPILLGLIPLGLSAVFTMTLTQTVMALGQTKLNLTRAIMTFGLSLVFSVIVFGTVSTTEMIAIALSAANFIALIWYLREVSKRHSRSFFYYIDFVPPICSGLVMFACIYQSDFPLIGQIITGTLIYLVVLTIFHLRLPLWAHT